ncbi:MAG: hypothetical protein WC683_19845, partial [bacterium]
RQLRVRAQPPGNTHFTDEKATLLGAAADMLEVDEHIDALRTAAAERIKELEARLAQLEAPQQAAVACAPCASCGQFMPAAAREIFKGYCHACTAGAAVLNQKALDNARRFSNAREADFEREVDQRKKAEDAVELLEKKLTQNGTTTPITIAWEPDSNHVVVTYNNAPSVRIVTRRS